MKKDLSCWVMTTGEAGMRSQVIGLAERIAPSFSEKIVSLNAPWRWLPGHFAPYALSSMAYGGDKLSPPWPDLLITCGRRSVALSLAIKNASQGKTFTVHIQDPRIPPQYFDMVACPRHDGIAGPNVYSTLGALHKVTPEKLQIAKNEFKEKLAHLPHPLVAVLIGGNSKSYKLTPEIAAHIGARLRELSENGNGVVVTFSARTDEESKSIITKQLATSGAYIWDGNGENPYLGMLGLADYIIVTSDSVSMITEATSTGKPVLIIELQGGSKKFDAFHSMMQEEGFIAPFSGELSHCNGTILDETGRIASIVLEKMAKH